MKETQNSTTVGGTRHPSGSGAEDVETRGHAVGEASRLETLNANLGQTGISFPSNIILQLEGNADDLLMINETGSMKCTRLIYLPENENLDEEVVDICVTSTNVRGEHPLFDKMKGKKVRMTVAAIG